MQENFCNLILDFVKENDLNPGDLGLEITETAELEDRSRASEYFEKLKKHGIPLALDDFGAGYSSLSYLRDLPITLVKLDKDFSRTVSEEEKRTELLNTMRAIGRGGTKVGKQLSNLL